MQYYHTHNSKLLEKVFLYSVLCFMVCIILHLKTPKNHNVTLFMSINLKMALLPIKPIREINTEKNDTLKRSFISPCSIPPFCLFQSLWIHQGNQTPPVEYFKRPYRSVATDPPRTTQKLRRISRANMIALQNEQLVKCLCIDGITFNDGPEGMKGLLRGFKPHWTPFSPSTHARIL